LVGRQKRTIQPLKFLLNMLELCRFMMWFHTYIVLSILRGFGGFALITGSFFIKTLYTFATVIFHISYALKIVHNSVKVNYSKSHAI
jgi:hypothetical protein